MKTQQFRSTAVLIVFAPFWRLGFAQLEGRIQMKAIRHLPHVLSTSSLAVGSNGHKRGIQLLYREHAPILQEWIRSRLMGSNNKKMNNIMVEV